VILRAGLNRRSELVTVDEITGLLAQCTEDERREIFERLRAEFSIHPIEHKLNIQAEVILEAIARASDLSLRGVRGLITEAVFERNVLPKLSGWTSLPLIGDRSYDFLLSRGPLHVRVQVKMQRMERGIPKIVKSTRSETAGYYVVETQKTRTGVDSETGALTRPYRFGQFDVLAVSLQPATEDWNRFMYALAGSLKPSKLDPGIIATFQEVPPSPTSIWTDDLATCLDWFLSLPRQS
jgi:hypothetical protein